MRFSDVYRGKTVLVTGHTGFKGSWLSEWLSMLGARVVGYSLRPDRESDPCFTSPSHFLELGLREELAGHIEGDVGNLSELEAALADHDPDFLFHLAAQPLVLRGYEDPYGTFQTNVVGSLNLLEALRRRGKACVAVMITTDKVYENLGWVHSYREPDALGGSDPYSASKACAELVVSSYARSFFGAAAAGPARGAIAVASVRGGNVIGGGDWAENRIVPDAMRALAAGRPVPIRNRHATRPWQHVLEPLGGYLLLGSQMARRRQDLLAAREEGPGARSALDAVCTSFNFGPLLPSNRPVAALVEEIFKSWPGRSEDRSTAGAPREAGRLNLTIDKAFHLLGWQPRWGFEETVAHTVDWYRRFYASARGDTDKVRALTRGQIEAYSEGLAAGADG